MGKTSLREFRKFTRMEFWICENWRNSRKTSPRFESEFIRVHPWLNFMKLLFSEQNSDYDHYQFPYAIWAVPESGETPSDIFNAGFLPSSRNLDRFYLCRQVRVNLAKFKPTSENRRILRKGTDIEVKLVP